MSGSPDSPSGSQTGSYWRNIAMQPSFRLVALLEESIEYDRHWTLPFHSLALCAEENPRDPSWFELKETGERMFAEKGDVTFMAAGTPVRIRYTTANRHLAIHFRYELFPGVDVFAGLRGRFRIKDAGGALTAKIAAVFAETDDLRRFAAAESAVLDAILPFWPEHSTLDLVRLAPYGDVLRDMADTLDARTAVGDLAARMGLSEAHFPAVFRSLVGMAPKQWLEQALFDRARRMLSDPRRTVRDVAYALEFSDEFNFSRFVKRRSGYSPTQLRSTPQGPVSNWK